jgi:hypothetical protein
LRESSMWKTGRSPAGRSWSVGGYLFDKIYYDK